MTSVPLKEGGRSETIPLSLTWSPEDDDPALRRFLSLARKVAKTAAATSELSRVRVPCGIRGMLLVRLISRGLSGQRCAEEVAY
jgi:hypothetical protein